MIAKERTYSLSYWERETFFGALDVLIIGSGIVGLNAALRLKELEPSLNIAVLDRGVLPLGASTRNAGFACFGSMTELLDDLKKVPEAAVWALVEKRWQGLQRLRKRLGDTAIDYEALGGYEVFRPEEEAIFQQCEAQIPAFNKILQSITGQQATYRIVDSDIEKFRFQGVKHLILNQAEGQLHTGKMMASLLRQVAAAGIQLYNGVAIEKIEYDQQCVTFTTAAGWEITTKRAIVATNGFAKQLFPDLDLQPARNQVLITNPIPNLRLRGAFHYDKGYYYFRNVDNRILLGGGRHLAPQTESTDAFGTTALIQEALVRLLREVILPGQAVEIDTWWSGILGIGAQKKPIVNRVSDKLVVAVRLGGMGVAIGSLVGEEAAECLLGHR